MKELAFDSKFKHSMTTHATHDPSIQFNSVVAYKESKPMKVDFELKFYYYINKLHN
jgi:hypothetical protein